MTEEREIEITESLTYIRTTLDRFDRELFGNGQPGQLSVISGRVKVLEDYKSTIKGIVTALGGLVSLLGGTTLYHLFVGTRGK